MKNHFLSMLRGSHIRETITLFIIAVLLISISLLVGINDNISMIVMFFIGIVFFLYAVLYPWGKARYYAIMGVIFLMLFTFELLAGIDLLVKMQLKSHMAEEIAMFFGFVCMAGVFAAIIGFFVFARRKK